MFGVRATGGEIHALQNGVAEVWSTAAFLHTYNDFVYSAMYAKHELRIYYVTVDGIFSGNPRENTRKIEKIHREY